MTLARFLKPAGPVFRSLPASLCLGLVLGATPTPAPDPAPAWPEIDAQGWVNLLGEAPSMERLKGRTVVLIFLSTDLDPAIQGQANWRVVRKMEHDYRGKGVVYLGICRESTAQVREYMRDHELPFPIACGSSAHGSFGASSEFFQILVDRKGKEVWRGPTNGVWNGLLLKTSRGSDRPGTRVSLQLNIDGELARQAEKSQERCADGELGKAMGDMDDLLAKEDLKPGLRQDAELVRDSIVGHVELLLRQAQEHFQDGEVLPALEVLELLAKEFKRHELGASVRASLEAFEADPRLAEEREASEKYADLVADYWNRGHSKTQPRLEKLISNFSETRAAQKARNLLALR